MIFSLVYEKVKMILWSIRTFWYKGSAKTMENDKFEKKASLSLSLKNSSPDSKAVFSGKVFIWYLEVNIECVAFKMTYL